MSQRFAPGQAPVQSRYQPPPPAPGMRPYPPPGATFPPRGFPLHPNTTQPVPGTAPGAGVPGVPGGVLPGGPGGPGSLLQRSAQQPTFQSGLRGTGGVGGGGPGGVGGGVGGGGGGVGGGGGGGGGSGSGGGSKRSNEARGLGSGPGGKGEFVAAKKKKKLADKILPQKVRDLVPESQAYMDLLTFERKLDATIMRKRLDIQEALKRPMKQKRKLRIFISNTFYPSKEPTNDGEEGAVASWELRVEGRLLEDGKGDPNTKIKRKFSSFFKSLVIELDKELYGPDNHLVEWHRTHTTQETDGFQVKRPGDRNVRCTILLLLDYQPLQFKLDPRLARLLGVHTQTRPVIISALWQYIKTHKLQDAHEREYINCDKYLEQIFSCQRMKFAEIPQRLNPLLHPPDPIVINHFIESGAENKQTACYDIDVEVDDTLKNQMNSFLMSTASQQEIQGLDTKIHETVDTINQMKTNREFFLSFAKDPQMFIHRWIISQTRDLKLMTDVVGNPEEERRAEFYYQPWTHEAVSRYFFTKVNQKRAELEQALGIRNG